VRNGLPRETIAKVAWLLIVIGLAPYVCLLLWPLTHNLEPLSVPLSLKRGEFVSPYFKTDLDDNYQIDLDWSRFPDRQTMVDLDWRIVTDTGALVQQGEYKDRTHGGNIVGLGTYRPKRGLRQRIVVNIRHDVQAPDAQARLHIGLPEVSLDLAEGYYPVAGLWAGVLAGSGLIILFVQRVWRSQRHEKH
jgi:hypothetical protein